MQARREEARRSVMVQVKGRESAADLYSYCSNNFGKITGIRSFMMHQPAQFKILLQHFFSLMFWQQFMHY